MSERPAGRESERGPSGPAEGQERVATSPGPTGPRVVRAPRGAELTCRGWVQEAALRMLMNNLDPDVAERPDDLVVYGGTGRAARSWEAFDAIVSSLRGLADDETLLVQSGKPVGVFRTHEWAPRVLIANANLVPDWATWDEFRRLEGLGLTMYGQMTAGSWIYIGTQGILQGTYECFAAIAAKRFGGSLRGTVTLTAGLGGMGGAQPLAVTMNGGVAVCVDVDPDRIERRRQLRYLDRVAADMGEAWTLAAAAKAAGEPLSIGVCGNAAEVVPALAGSAELAELVDIVTDQTPAHDPLSYVPVGLDVRCRRPTSAGETPTPTSPAAASRWCATAPAWWRSPGGASRSSTTATPSGPRPRPPATTTRSTYPGFLPAYIRPLFCEGKGPFRWAALSGDPADIEVTDRLVLEEFPENEALGRWIRMAPERVQFQGLPARICWLGYGERSRLGLRFNELVASGEISAPIVIGRDHLDSGSVASPYRETESMLDGSDAIADWPILNALLNTASGASWVSFHHGGGVGIGRSLHAGMVVVADGTALAAEKLERVLTTDPGIGVVRHADAGYDEAREVAARARRCRLPDARRDPLLGATRRFA